MLEINLHEHGFVRLTNIAGPVRRLDALFDADDIDPPNTARMSFDQQDDETRTREEDYKLAEYLYRSRHTTPFEMIECWFTMQLPIVVARQLVRHRTVSINEVSARYTKLEPMFYIPRAEDVGIKSKSNKQGRDIVPYAELPPERKNAIEEYRGLLRMSSEMSYKVYEDAIGNGIPNELARLSLPLNIYTKWVWKQDLHNLMHMMTLRQGGTHAQNEVQVYANACHDILAQVLPVTMAMFDGYQMVMQKKVDVNSKG